MDKGFNNFNTKVGLNGVAIGRFVKAGREIVKAVMSIIVAVSSFELAGWGFIVAIGQFVNAGWEIVKAIENFVKAV